MTNILFWALSTLGLVLGLVGMQGSVSGWASSGTFKIAATTLFFFIGTSIPLSIGFTKSNFVMLLGLFFVLLGDFFLSYLGTTSVFLYGMINFMLGYALLAASAGLRTEWKSLGSTKKGFSVIIILCIFTAIGVSVFLNLDKIGDNTLPILIYLIVQISLVSLSYASNNPWLIVGAIFLFISDVIIALNLFSSRVSFGNLYQYLIMPTYYLGLASFIRGFYKK
jgi:hypothetical protein